MEHESDFQLPDFEDAESSTLVDKRFLLQDDALQARNAFIASWLIAVPGFVIAGLALFVALTSPPPRQFLPFSATLALSLAALASVWLSRKKRHVLGLNILLGVFWCALILISVLVEGLGLILAIGGFITTLAVAGTTLPPRAGNLAIMGGLVTAAVIALVEVLNFGNPLETPDSIRTWIYPVISLSLAALLILVLYQFKHYSLRVKLLVVFVLLCLAAVGGEITFYNIFIRDVLTQRAEESLRNAAKQTAGTLDSFIDQTLDTLNAESQLPVFTTYLKALEDDTLSDTEFTRVQSNVLSVLNTLQQKQVGFITSYALLDRSGVDVADTYMPDVGTDKFGREYFQVAVQDQEPYVSSVRFYTKAEEGSAAGQTGGLYFSTPVIDASGEVIGVLRVRYAALILQTMIIKNNGLGGTASFPLLIDANYHVMLAHGDESNWIYKSIASLDESEIIKLQEASILPPGDKSQVVADLRDLLNGVSNFEETDSFTAEAHFEDPEHNLEQVVLVASEHQSWSVGFVQPRSEFLALVEQQSERAIFLALLIGAGAVFASVIVARFLANPLVNLTDVAQEVAQGNFDVSVPVETGDEIGILAMTFNLMTSRLSRILSQLEGRVVNRTQALEQRSRYLEATAEVGRVVTSILEPEQLISEVVDLIQERFGLYYVGLFLLDSRKQWAELRAGTGEAGQVMLARGHRLPVDPDQSMIGWCVVNGEARVAQDVELDDVRRATSELPETRAELALPLRARSQVLGALTVQSKEYGIFDQDAIRVLQIMADQVAAALDTAQLYSQSQAALETASRVYGELNRQAWSELLRSSPEIMVRSDRYGVSVHKGELTSPDHSDEATASPPSDEAVSLKKPLRVPIRGRGGVIGILETYKPGADANWAPDEVTVLKEITDRIGEALDGARLYQDTQRSAIREQLTSEITARIREEVEVEAILEKAVEELGRALDANRATVFLEVGNE